MTSEVKAISIIVLITVVVIIGGLTLTGRSTATPSIVIDKTTLVSSTTPVEGPKNAKVSIVEFGDFACPACAQLYPQLKSAMAMYPSDVSLSLRIIPIHKEESIKSAIAAYAAGEQGKFFEMGDLLFTNQNAWFGKSATVSRGLFLDYAKTLKLDIPKFTALIDSADFRSKVQAMINKDDADATAMKIQSTPTIILNGEKVIVGSQSAAALAKTFENYGASTSSASTTITN